MSENPYEPMSKEQKDAIVQGNGLTYTHEQMRQVQHAIAAGKNPLVVLENVPRWEDMAGVDRIEGLDIDYPEDFAMAEIIAASRNLPG